MNTEDISASRIIETISTDKHGALLDVTSLSLLQEKRWSTIDELARENLPPVVKHQVLSATLSRDLTLRHALLVLETLVLFDVLIFDQVAGDIARLEIPASVSSILYGIRVPLPVYKTAYEAAWRADRALHAKDSTFWNGDEKRYHDRLHQVHPVFAMASSRDSLARAVFYLELSVRLGGIPAMLSQGKGEWLAALRETINASAHARIVALVRAEMLKAGGALLDADVDVPSQPVMQLILRKAMTANQPLLRTALELRESQQAIAYRAKLRELAEALGNGRTLDATALAAEIRGAVAKWATTGDRRLDVTLQQKKAKFAGVPMIGWILDAFEMAEFDYKDPILWPKKHYLGFISSWL